MPGYVTGGGDLITTPLLWYILTVFLVFNLLYHREKEINQNFTRKGVNRLEK